MYQALYRKYRPTVFDDVCGQEHITSVLKYETETNRVSHAYLFCGSRGTGKTTCAKILAKAVNCENPQNGNPCCQCESCRSIDASAAPDVLEMDAASNNGVDYIRDIREAVAYTPAMLKKRVYIIDEVHMLSTSAFNALLKTLEEPPEHVVFILATTELHKLPSTIVSRCQRFDFRRIPLAVLSERLHYIAEQESVSLDPQAAQRIARQAQGGMRDAISLFELCCGGGADVTVERVQEILGLSGTEQLTNIATALSKGDMRTVFPILHEVVSSSKDITVFWQELTSFYRDMMIIKYCDDPVQYLDITEQELQLLQDSARLFSIQMLTYHSTILDDALVSMQKMPQMKRTIAEFSCLKMCEPQLEVSPEALSARIGQLEDKLAMLEMGAAPAIQPKSDSSVLMPQPASETTPSHMIKDTHKEDAPEWNPLEDTSELLEKLAETDKQTQSFLGNASICISPDGTKVAVHVENDFIGRMLSAESAKQSIARALMLCKISAGHPDVRIVIRKNAVESNPAADELYRNTLQ